MSNRYSGFSPIALAVSSLICGTSLEMNTAVAKEKPIDINSVFIKENKNNGDKNETEENTGAVDLGVTVKDPLAEIESLNIQYSLGKQFLAEQFYKPSNSNYNAFVLGNQTEPKFSYESDEKKMQLVVVSDSDSEMLTVKEAEELFTESQSAYVVGAAHDVSAAKRRKLDYFAKFEPAYFGLFMAQALTREINFNSY